MLVTLAAASMVRVGDTGDALVTLHGESVTRSTVWVISENLSNKPVHLVCCSGRLLRPRRIHDYVIIQDYDSAH